MVIGEISRLQFICYFQVVEWLRHLLFFGYYKFLLHYYFSVVTSSHDMKLLISPFFSAEGSEVC
jgi:hypothetical protein